MANESTSQEIPSATKRGDEFSDERRDAIRVLAVKSLGIGRQNLHDTQFSCNAKVIGFYEGIALGMQRLSRANVSPTSSQPSGPSANELLFEDRKRFFSQAATLTGDPPSKPTSEADIKHREAHRTVGLEALLNLATLHQQWALGEQKLIKAELMLTDAQRTDLSKAIGRYQEALGLIEGLSAHDGSRIRLTANLGLLVCSFALWCNDQQADAKLSSESSRKAHTFLEEVRKQLSKDSVILNRSCDADVDSANSQILQQIRGFLKRVDEALPPMNPGDISTLQSPTPPLGGAPLITST